MTQEEYRRIMQASANRYGAPRKKSGASASASPGKVIPGDRVAVTPVHCAIKPAGISQAFPFDAIHIDFRGATGRTAAKGSGGAGCTPTLAADHLNPPVHEDASR